MLPCHIVVIFMGLGGAKRRGFKVIVTEGRGKATKKGNFYGWS